MNIVIIGANGFVGKYVFGYFYNKPGMRVIGIGRTKPDNIPLENFYCKNVLSVSKEEWSQIIPNDSIVINCVGVLESPDGSDIEHNALWMNNLFALTTIKKFIYFSALGVSKENQRFSPYIQSRVSAEGIIADYAIKKEFVAYILRPSFIYGHTCYGGSESLRALAGASGVIPMYKAGGTKFAPVCIQDINHIINSLLSEVDKPGTSHIIPISGPDILTTKEIVKIYSKWLNTKGPTIIYAPLILLKIMGQLGRFIPLWNMSPAMVRQMQMDYIEPHGGSKYVRGIRMQSMHDFLIQNPANDSERYHSNIGFIRPFLYISIIFMWIFSGILGLTSYKKGLKEFPFLAKKVSLPLVILSSLIDLYFAKNMLQKKPDWFKQILMVLSYTIGLSFLKRSLWKDLYGGLMKNIPIIGLLYVMKKTEHKR